MAQLEENWIYSMFCCTIWIITAPPWKFTQLVVVSRLQAIELKMAPAQQHYSEL